MAKSNADPLQVNARLYKQVSKLLDDLEQPPLVKKGKKGEPDEVVEGVTLRERIAALTAIARIQIGFITLRAEEQPDERSSGSAVRKYTAAFKQDASRRRAKGAGPATTAKPVAIDDLDRDDPDDIA